VVIALLDVDYRASGARAACVLAQSWSDVVPASEHSIDIRSVQAYEPGSFYRRELPCLLEALDTAAIKPSIAVVDGYVWLGGEARPGLGFHLYQALGSKIPVIGIAKTAFLGAEESEQVAKVLRGESKRPLFVTAVGVELASASSWVQCMAGAHRIPSLVAAVDRLARSAQPAMQNAA
jgi:deoxyribonuclease V